jgi:hypothetical protein
MKTAQCLFSLLTGAALLCGSGCENDSAKQAAPSITGRWMLTQALRNQRETETLRGTYFEFMPDGRMQTNLPIGAESPTPYTIEDGAIRQQSTPPVVYRIVSSSDSTLELATELRGLPFVMRFRRALEGEADPSVPDTLGVEELSGDSVGQ